MRCGYGGVAHLAMRDGHKMGDGNGSEALGYCLISRLRRRLGFRSGSFDGSGAPLPPLLYRSGAGRSRGFCCTVPVAQLSLRLMPTFLPLFFCVFGASYYIPPSNPIHPSTKKINPKPNTMRASHHTAAIFVPEAN